MREREIFIAALQRDDPEDRGAFVDEACRADEGLRDRVQALLGTYQKVGSFLLEPAANLAVPGAFASTDANATQTIGQAPAEGPGTVIGPYTLMEQIGEGGMGVVYVAEQARPVRRRVALKVIKPGMDTKQVLARFEAERQALAMMDHPNIAKVHDGGTTESGRPYFVMELVDGVPITEYCDTARLSIHDRLELFVLVCRAVQHAHQKGIIHRDLKPSNVMVTVIDGVAVPKVIDFGVAKATGDPLNERTLLTGFAQLIGTPLYMSPEQAGMAGIDVDTRSDIYSLGVLLYELLTGSTPFDAETLRKAAIGELQRIIREDEPPKPSMRLSSLGETLTPTSMKRSSDPRHLNRSVRGDLDWIAMKALEKDRKRRYETANDFAADVMRYLTDRPVEARSPSIAYRLQKFAFRNRKSLAVATLLTALGVTVMASLGVFYLQSTIRVRHLTQDVRQSLAGARTAIEAGDLVLAGRRAAEAQGRLGGDRASVHGLAAEADAVTGEIQDRLAEEDRFRRFLKLTSDAQDEMSFGGDGSGLPRAEEALRLYGVLDADDWTSGLDRPSLTEDRKRQIRETAYVTLVSLADYGVRWQGKRDDPKSVQRSLDLLRRAESFHTPTRAFYFVRSECYRHQKNTTASDEDVKRFKAAEAKTAWDYYLPGHTAGWGGDLDEAIRSYRAALTLQPNHYNSLFFLAMRFNTDKINRRPEAVQLFTACIALRPDDFQGYRNRGATYFRLGQLDDAIADARQMVRLRPDLVLAHNILGATLMEQRKSDEAIASYTEGVRVQPDDATAHNNLGEALLRHGRLDEAIACYNEALRLNPDDGCTYHNLGVALLRKGELDQALTACKKSVRLGPTNHASHHHSLGIALAAKGELVEALAGFNEAIACYNEALRLAPGDAQAHRGLASLLATCPVVKVRDPVRAVALARKAVELSPEAGDIWHTLGVARYRVGEWDSAIAALEKSETLAPPDMLPARRDFFLAMSHWRLRHADEARTWYDKAVAWMEKNQPRNEELRRFRAEAEALMGLAELPADVFASP